MVEATHGVRQGHRTVALVTVAQRLIVILHHRPWIVGASIGTWTAYSVYLLFPPKPVDFFRSAEVVRRNWNTGLISHRSFLFGSPLAPRRRIGRYGEESDYGTRGKDET